MTDEAKKPSAGKTAGHSASRLSEGEGDDAGTDAQPPRAGTPAPAGDEVPPGQAAASRLTPAMQRHLRTHLNEDALAASVFHTDSPMPYQPLSIVLQNVRANSKVLITIRDDQAAVWSEGNGKGIVGLSFSTTRDAALYLSNFLINAREFFVQTYNDSQEILVQLYVRTGQPDLRGRVDLPPGAVATLQSSADRTSVVGLSAFAIDF